MRQVLRYREVWVLDFEYIAKDGECPDVVCMVAYEIYSGRRLHLWRDELDSPPFSLADDVLFVAYAAVAEWSCFLALGWPIPSRCIDLYAEFVNLLNGSIDGKLFPSLLAACAHFGIDTITGAYKEEMRDLILSGGPWDDTQRTDILAYCESDVIVTVKLLHAMTGPCFSGFQALGFALFRGRYTCAVARMERNGIPVDVVTLSRLTASWDLIREDLVRAIDADYGVYNGISFVTARFAEYLVRHDIPWPRLPSGSLMLDDDTFKERAGVYPELSLLREHRHSMGQLKLSSIKVGADGRNRVSLMPFASKTGRNQPSNSKFIFGAARWLRSLICPPPGYAIAYIDWSSQEIAIAAALSGDQVMWSDYCTGDPYLAFAKQANQVPADATKHSHKVERQRAKAIVLGIGYGMSPESIAMQSGMHIDQARELWLRHKTTYRVFWAWAEANQNAGLMGGALQSRFGWRWQAGRGTSVNPRSLLNWPMQANGAEMMRLACCLLTERGIKVCCPVHDALLIEAKVEDIEEAISITQELMGEASEIVLGAGYRVRTDVDRVFYPDRYEDERGTEMWAKVMAILNAKGL